MVSFPEAEGPLQLQYDEEWLAVLRTTHSLMSLQRRAVSLPGARTYQLPAPAGQPAIPGFIGKYMVKTIQFKLVFLSYGRFALTTRFNP